MSEYYVWVISVNNALVGVYEHDCDSDCHHPNKLITLTSNLYYDVKLIFVFIVAKQYFDSGRFWLWRWIHVMDSTSNSPVILQLYRTNQVGLFSFWHYNFPVHVQYFFCFSFKS